MSSYPLVESMSLLAVGPGIDATDHVAGSDLPGETVLREAIMKKVLDELSGVEGVLGNVVALSDGLPIDMQVPDSINPELVGVILTQAIGDCQPEIEFLQLKPVYQYLLVTLEQSYSVMPINGEAYLISFLSGSVPREIWQNRLDSAVAMLSSAFL